MQHLQEGRTIRFMPIRAAIAAALTLAVCSVYAGAGTAFAEQRASTIRCYAVLSVPVWAADVPARFGLEDVPVSDTSVTLRMVRRVTADGRIAFAMAGSWWQTGGSLGGPSVTFFRPPPSSPVTLLLPAATNETQTLRATLSDGARNQEVMVSPTGCTL